MKDGGPKCCLVYPNDADGTFWHPQPSGYLWGIQHSLLWHEGCCTAEGATYPAHLCSYVWSRPPRTYTMACLHCDRIVYERDAAYLRLLNCPISKYISCKAISAGEKRKVGEPGKIHSPVPTARGSAPTPSATSAFSYGNSHFRNSYYTRA